MMLAGDSFVAIYAVDGIRFSAQPRKQQRKARLLEQIASIVAGNGIAT